MEHVTMGINVRSNDSTDYAWLIVHGRKTLETRRSDSLRPYVGQRVGIVRTGMGQASLVGYVTVGEPTIMNREQFRQAEEHHLVTAQSEFDIGSDQYKWCYPMIDPVALTCPMILTTRGIIARRIQEQEQSNTGAECLELLSSCCGSDRHEYVDDHCASCGEHAEFFCPGCGRGL